MDKLRKGFLLSTSKSAKEESKGFEIIYNLDLPLIRLPVEILHIIVRFISMTVDGCLTLPDITVISRLARTCKYLYNIIWLSDLWKYFGQRIQRLALESLPRITINGPEEFRRLFCSDRVNEQWKWHYQGETGSMNVHIDYKGRCFFGASAGPNIIIKESHLPFQEYIDRAAKFSIHCGNKFNLGELDLIRDMYVLHIGISGPTITLVSPSGLVVMQNYVTDVFPNMNILFAPTIFHMKQKLAQLVMTEFGLTLFLGEFGQIYVVSTMSNPADIYYRYGPIILDVMQVKQIIRKENTIGTIGSIPFELVTKTGVVKTTSGELFRECLDKVLKKKLETDKTS